MGIGPPAGSGLLGNDRWLLVADCWYWHWLLALGPSRLALNGGESGVRYMVIENFRPGKVAAIYRRLDESGRHMPAGLTYVGSWITDDLARCYQVMECDDTRLLDEWIAHWADLMDFEVIPVLSSAEARERALANT